MFTYSYICEISMQLNYTYISNFNTSKNDTDEEYQRDDSEPN